MMLMSIEIPRRVVPCLLQNGVYANANAEPSVNAGQPEDDALCKIHNACRRSGLAHDAQIFGDMHETYMHAVSVEPYLLS